MSALVTIEDARQTEAARAAPEWVKGLQAMSSADQVFTDFETRLQHSRDRLPLGRFHNRSKKLTGTLPSAVVRPDSSDEVNRIVKFAAKNKIGVIPYGAGSGVLGGTVPFNGEMMIVLDRINRIVEIDEANCVVRVEAGANGGVLEEALKQKGYTCGHYPQSVNMSTVGGWVACRGSGQSSSRYGNIENMIVGMRVVLPSGELLDVRHAPRRSVGPSLIELFIGSEGAFGIIVEVTMRIWRLPEHQIDQVVGFPGVAEGLGAVRDVMQAEIRPSIVRLYDENESEHWGKDWLPLATNPVMCMFEFSGSRAVAEAEATVALDICGRHGAVKIDGAPLRNWKNVRYQSYSDEFVDAGGFYDTIEIAAPWSVLHDLHTQIRSAVTTKHPFVQINAHWSHVYADGACMYMTAKFPAMEDEEGLRIHSEIWDIAMRLCLDMGGTVSHHHGIGYFRNEWLVEELNAGHGILRDLKRCLDPDFIFNPGKLGLVDEI